MYEELLKNIRKIAWNNNLDANNLIYIKRLDGVIIDFSLFENEGYMKEKLGNIILEMEEK